MSRVGILPDVVCAVPSGRELLALNSPKRRVKQTRTTHPALVSVVFAPAGCYLRVDYMRGVHWGDARFPSPKSRLDFFRSVFIDGTGEATCIVVAARYLGNNTQHSKNHRRRALGTYRRLEIVTVLEEVTIGRRGSRVGHYGFPYYICRRWPYLTLVLNRWRVVYHGYA